MNNNFTITREDLEKYKEQIDCWKNYRKLLIEYKLSLSPEELKDFPKEAEEVIANDLSDEEMCAQIKEVFEYKPEVSPKDYVTYANWILDLKNRYPEEFKTDEDVILFRKTRENELKKMPFIPRQSKFKSISSLEEAEKRHNDLIEKGYFCNE